MVSIVLPRYPSSLDSSRRLAAVRRLAPLACSLCRLVLACCLAAAQVIAPTPQTVVGTVPADRHRPARLCERRPGRRASRSSRSKGCSACHTFKPAGSTGKVGPDLDDLADAAKKANRGARARLLDRAPGAMSAGFPNAMPPTYARSSPAAARRYVVAFLARPEPPGGLPARRRGRRHRPRPHADLDGRRPASAHARRARAGRTTPGSA